MKRESKLFVIYIHQTTHNYLNEYVCVCVCVCVCVYIYIYINSVHIIHIMESKLLHINL